MAQSSSIEKWSQWDLLKLNSFSFGITGFILAMDTVVLPVIVLTVAPDEFKNTYLAILGISGLVMAAMVQPTIGRISDRTRSAFGRRVPFIISGAVFSAIGLVGIRLAPNFGVLFAVWIFIQANVNIAYGPGLALIRDCVPLNRIGMASSMKDHVRRRWRSGNDRGDRRFDRQYRVTRLGMDLSGYSCFPHDSGYFDHFSPGFAPGIKGVRRLSAD